MKSKDDIKNEILENLTSPHLPGIIDMLLEEYATQSASQNNQGEGVGLWEELPVSEFKDLQNAKWYTVVSAMYLTPYSAFYENGRWVDYDGLDGTKRDVTDNITHYLRRTTVQGYSEADMEEAVDFGFRQCKLYGYVNLEEEAKFIKTIQSLNKK